VDGPVVNCGKYWGVVTKYLAWISAPLKGRSGRAGCPGPVLLREERSGACAGACASGGRNRILLLLAVLLPFSCEKSIPPGEPRLVVEGWIENGGHPTVLLSESFPVELNKAITAEDMVRNLVKWAKVTVSDGDQTVTLTGVMDLVSDPNLRQGDELWIKLRTMDRKSFYFWKNYETTILSNVFNMDFWVDSQSNIQGGLGYWIGYGVDQEVCLPLEKE